MLNLIRMDLYRMHRGMGFKVTLILAALFAIAMTPFGWAMTQLGNLFADTQIPFDKTAPLAGILSDPFPFVNAMLALIAAGNFFFADIEVGYIKNIAGQMPKRGYTVLSRYIASMVQCLLFMAVGMIGNLIGTAILQRITLEGDLLGSLRILALRFLLLQACSAILLLFAAGFRTKSLTTVMAVLMGSGLLYLVYTGIDLGVSRLFPQKGFSISDYMPDQLLGAANPKTLDALIVSAVTIGVFLPLSIRLFDKRDVK